MVPKIGSIDTGNGKPPVLVLLTPKITKPRLLASWLSERTDSVGLAPALIVAVEVTW